MEFKNFPDKKYDLIVVDPPWSYNKRSMGSHGKAQYWPYNTIKISDINLLPIQSIANSNSWIFLWTTQKYLFESKKILEQWGFEYQLCMVWKKTFGKSAGMPIKGFCFNAEFIIVGNMHKVSTLCKKGVKLIPCAFEAPNLGHSIKPQEFYSMIEHLGEKRIDLFARKERNGWDVWGDEI